MSLTEYKIIDFHTHPFLELKDNICLHTEFLSMDKSTILNAMNRLGIEKFCGSVISEISDRDSVWQIIKQNNATALTLRDFYKGRYVPGFHIHPDYERESLEEIEFMHANNVNLIGELVPERYLWSVPYGDKKLDAILDLAKDYQMVVSIHSQDLDGIDKMAKKHKDCIFVVAHPGEKPTLEKHIENMKRNENLYLDLSGTGIFRYGVVNRLINQVGGDRLVYGTDYPICEPSIYIGGILFDNKISNLDKEKIFYKNAKRLLKL